MSIPPAFRLAAMVLGAGVLVACDRGEAPVAAAVQPAEAAVETWTPRFGVAEPKPKPPGAVRVVTYNVENFFDDVDDPALSGRYEDAHSTKPAAQVEALAATIRRLDADIVALQEVESESVVREFRDTHLAGLGYEFLASVDAGDERGIEQAVLSRHPITEVKNWPRLELGGVHPEKWGNQENFNAGKPLRFHRSPLMVKVEVSRESEGEERGTYELTLFVVHLKSGREGDYWRRAEAAKTVELAAAVAADDPDANIIILGDFNATYNDAPLRLFRDAGFVDAFDVGRTPGPEYTTHASGRRIDFILLGPAVTGEFIEGTRFVLGTPSRPEGADWRTTPAPPGYVSDHYPVVIDLTGVDRSPLAPKGR